MIPTIHSISNPIKAISVISYINESVVELRKPKNVNPERFEIIKELVNKKINTRFRNTWENYYEYQNKVLENIHKVQGKEVIFLDMENQCLSDDFGKRIRLCYDDFSTKTEVSSEIIKVYQQYPRKLREIVEDIKWLRISPFLFPFQIQENKIINPFKKEAKTIEQIMNSKGKRGFGDQIRNLYDIRREENYKFSQGAFSFQEFRNIVNTTGSLDSLVQEHNENKHYSKKIDRNEYLELSKAAMAINRDLLVQKFSYIIKELGLKEINSYMIEKAIGKKIIQQVSKETGIPIRTPGIKLLLNTKTMPSGAELEAQALNRLSGWLSAKYTPGAEPIIIKNKTVKEEMKKISNPELPYLRTISTDKTFVERVKKEIDPEGLKALEKDIKDYQFSVDSMELIILKLNKYNFPVFLDDNKETQWKDCRKDSIIDPLDLTKISQTISSDKYLTRPSNCSAYCDLAKYISVQQEVNWPTEIEDNFFAKSGTARHEIANEIDSNQWKVLREYGIEGIKRKKYCEVPLVHEFKPDHKQWERAEDYILELIEKNKLNEYYPELLKMFKKLRSEKPIIYDAGSPDGVSIIRDSKKPIVMDIKRRMKTRYPTQSFFQQTARYGLGIIKNLNLEIDSFYSVIIQTPFHQNKFADTESKTNKGNYRGQAIVIREIKIDSEFLRNVERDLIIEYVNNYTLRENKDLRHSIIDWEKNHSKKYGCKTCFSNQKEDYKCNYLMTGRKMPWA